jgi:hypothetical protein
MDYQSGKFQYSPRPSLKHCMNSMYADYLIAAGYELKFLFSFKPKRKTIKKQEPW